MKKTATIALILGFTLTIIASAIGNTTHNNLANDVLRLHVIANSDSKYDQSLKLKVRDGILKDCSELLYGDNIEEVKTNASKNLKNIQETAQNILIENGSSYLAEVSICKSYFPTKNYGNFSLPAGKYDALKIIIGKGKGKNWWCVMFPPLCLAGATKNEAAICRNAGISEENINIMTCEKDNKPVYKIKFKLAELVGKYLS